MIKEPIKQKPPIKAQTEQVPNAIQSFLLQCPHAHAGTSYPKQSSPFLFFLLSLSS